ncbi:MAG: hypothetical protein SF182_19095 [Deltaproteobacteria bacterium]|nr:hypothetical protein [Deltaproteobacteria bacterium]
MTAPARYLGHLTRGLLFITALTTGVVALGNAARADTVTDDNAMAMMEGAKTSADFQALATYYRGKATQAKAAAQRHKSMQAAIGQGPGKPPYNWTAHCRRLIRLSQDQAADYTAMAAAYEKLAAEGAKPMGTKPMGSMN